MKHTGGGAAYNSEQISALANRGGGGSKTVVQNISITGYTGEDIRKQADAALLRGMREFDPAPSAYP